MYGYDYNPTVSTKQKQTRECLICLEDDTILQLKHYSEYNCDCSCNYYIHKRCLVTWIKKRGVSNAKCLLCSNPIVNANEIAGIDTRQTTEHHSRRARVIRLSLQELLNNGENVIQVQPTIQQEQQQNEIIIYNQRLHSDNQDNSGDITLAEIRPSGNTRMIICSIISILALFFISGVVIVYFS